MRPAAQAHRRKQPERRTALDLTAIVTWIIFGAIIGVIARFLMPGRDPMGWIATIVLGIVGSFVGGYLGQLLFQGNASLPPPSAGWIGSIIGALIVLAIYRYTQGRRVTV
jgi:uncharacterized membrane protein YeaQ/YmgE (transglycosylase-associated protein family)